MKADIQLTICAHREITVGTFGSFELLHLKSRLNFYTLAYSGDALIGRARSLACTNFLEKDLAPYILFVDDDIIFKPEDVEKIYDDLRQGYEIVGGCYPVKDATQLSSYGWKGTVPLDGQIVEVEYLATGFMGIAKTALAKIRDGLGLKIVNPNDWCRCYPFFENYGFYEREAGAIYLSEDWDFCEKARKVGLKVYLDTGIHLGHQGMRVFTIEQVIEYQKNKEKDARERSGEPSSPTNG